MLNIGYIEGTHGDVVIRIYYDTTYIPVGPEQPLINGPRGYCLDMTNISGRNTKIRILSSTGTYDVQVGRGNPVTTGPSNGRSRTKTELAGLGFFTRGDVASFAISE